MSVQHISDQRPAFEAALRIAEEHPGLPAVGVTVTVYASVSRAYFSVDSFSGWEAWRSALTTDPADVQGFMLGTGDLMLAFDANVGGYDVQVSVIDQVRSALASEAPPVRQQDPHPQGDPLAYGPSGVHCGCGKEAHSNLVPCQQVSREDTYKSPIHRDYTTPHDLPEFPAPRDRRHV